MGAHREMAQRGPRRWRSRGTREAASTKMVGLVDTNCVAHAIWSVDIRTTDSVVLSCMDLPSSDSNATFFSNVTSETLAYACSNLNPPILNYLQG